MPFLFPALAAAVCDIGILYLGHRNYVLEKEYHSLTADDGLLVVEHYKEYGFDDDDDDTGRRVYHYGYIVWLAAIRLFLLLIPLPYHSFLGKALRCPMVYQLFYGVTLVCVLLHALTLLMVDPGSLSSLVKAIVSYSNEADHKNGQWHHILVTRSLWVALSLTLVSTLNHIALFFHVRSTAPVDAEFLVGGRRRPKVLLYYAKEKKATSTNQHNHRQYHRNGSSQEREGLLSGTSSSGVEDEENIGLPLGNGSSHHGKNYDYGEETPPFGRNIHANGFSSSHTSSGRALQEISNKLMMEIQVRLRKAKKDWTKKLEDYQKPLRAADRQALHLQHPAPFRVILELFASDDNSNHATSNGTSNGNSSNVHDHGSIRKLDAVYDKDDGEALMLFVPQLLSFLLHGAYESSYPLEEWILETCQKNLFFAHKCYWFLRAWSLETSSSVVAPENEVLSMPGHHHPQSPVTRLSHSSSLTSFATQEDDPHNVSKLLPEERAVIEDLMRKIMKCGEEPARRLHFGSTVGQLHLESVPPPGRSVATSLFAKDDPSSSGLSIGGAAGGGAAATSIPNYSASALTPSSAANSSLIPVNPLTHVPSLKHFDCLAAKRRHGFLPLDDDAALTASYNQSILNGNPCGTSYFDSCPVFLDALITIADNLFLVPRNLRREEFKKQLRLLEVEALPCNEIYIPLQNNHHRVWRIVAEESIPLSTKERVPCILCLEVVSYTPESTSENEAGDNLDLGNLFKRRALTGSNLWGGSPSERDMVDSWRNSPRDPYRRETALYRVTHGMGKIPDKMKESMQEMQVSMEEMKESIRQGISHMRETADGKNELFWSGHSTPERSDSKGSLTNAATNGHGNSKDATAPASPLPEFDASPSKTAQSPSKHQQGMLQPPSSPRTPRCPIQQGKMGQWTKSPAPKGSLVSATSPSRVIEIADTAVEDLSAPAMKSKYKSYQTVTANGTTSSNGNNNTMNRRRFSRPNSFSSRVNAFDLEINGSYSNDYADDSENDYSEREIYGESTPTLSNGHPKPPSKPPPVVFKENWKEKEDRLRATSAYGNHPGWKLLPVLVKSNDDLRQEQLASQLIQRMALILARDQVPVWLCPYEILALDASGGIIEAIPDTISLASLKKNDPEYTDLKGFFEQYFYENDTLADAKANFCESLAAYSIVCFLLQIKDRHNGNILLDNRGHLIHIDFGFFFLSSPGKNTGFESAPFKLTREFVTVLGGPDSHLFGVFRTLCYRTFISLRKHCHEIILLVEMLQLGNEDLACFRGRPEDAIRELRQRFRLDLNDRACLEYVNALIDESLENWRTNWYDRYQRYCVGVL